MYDDLTNAKAIAALQASLDQLILYARGEFKQGSDKSDKLDEKIDRVMADMADIASDVAVTKDKVNRVHKTVLEGNGQPAMVERLAVVERLVGESKTTVEDNSRALSAPPDKALQIAGVTAKWQFWAVVVPVLLLLLANFALLLLGKAPIQH